MILQLALCVGCLTGTIRPAVDHVGAKGQVVERMVPSKTYGRDRRVWVYMPADYPSACIDGCSLVVAFDGGEYRRPPMGLPAMLDSLVALKRIPPTVAVLVDNASSTARLDDLANHERFAAFIDDELMSWTREHWRITRDPAQVVITGSSAGGLAAAYLAFKRPDLFGNVLSQSGAFWRGNEGSGGGPYEWVTSQYRAAPKKAIRFYLDVGDTEWHGAMGGAAPSILTANRRLRDVLRAKGYAVEYFEVPGGIHGVSSWKERLPTGLANLLGVRLGHQAGRLDS
jgi:enterochelin esterase-like enzyme